MDTTLKFTASNDPLYVLAPGATPGAMIDQITARQSQLAALLLVTYGESGDAFRTLPDTYQNDYMWACGMLADEIQALTSALSIAAKLGAL